MKGIYTFHGMALGYNAAMKTKRSSSLQKCLAPIPPFIFWPKEMMQFLAEHRREWGMSGLNTVQLLNNLLQENLIVEAEFRSSKYAAIVRYLWGDHSREELALSLQRDSFLSHGSALAVHGIIAGKRCLCEPRANREIQT
jgi:hypothetical protein